MSRKKKSGEKLFAGTFFGTPFAVAAKMARGPLPMPKRQPASFLGSAACFWFGWLFP